MISEVAVRNVFPADLPRSFSGGGRLVSLGLKFDSMPSIGELIIAPYSVDLSGPR